MQQSGLREREGITMSEHLKRTDRTLKYEGAILKVYTDTMQLPDGRVTEWDFINHDGAAAVVPVTPDGKILMVRQFRNALDRDTLEIPAGKLDHKGESTLLCAKRELEEETGYHSDDLELLIRLCTWAAFTNEKVDVYAAHSLTPSKQHLDEDEFIDVEAYSMEELKEKIFSGEIQDAKTISALLAYDAKYGKQR